MIVRIGSRKRGVDRLRDTLSLAESRGGTYWRRLVSRPGWFIAFVRYEQKGKRS